MSRVEVLVVFFVCAILMASIPAAILSARESAHRTELRNNLRNVSMRFSHPGWYDNISRSVRGSADKTDLRLLMRALVVFLGAAGALGSAFVIRLIVRYVNNRDGWSMDTNGEWKRGRA